MGSSTSATPDPSTLGAGRGYQPNVNSPDPQQQSSAVAGPLSTATVLPGSGIAVSNAGGDATVSTTAPGGVSQITAGSGISVNQGTGNVTVSAADLASAYETQLTDTNLDTVATYTPAAAGIFEVRCYFRVVTATTTVTLQVTHTDAGGAQTTTLVNAVAEPVGSYTVMPLVVAQAAGQPITVKAQAGTANQLFVSAAIVG